MTSVRLFVTVLKGIVCGQAAVALFMLVLVAYAFHAQQVVDMPGASPVMDTLALWPRLAILATVAGALLGTLAGYVRKLRLLWILLASMVAYLGVCLGMLLLPGMLLEPGLLSGKLGDLLLVGLWVAVAYGIIALPLLVGASFAFERWTR